MRKYLLPLCCAAAIAATTGVQAQGLTPSPDALGGPFWQARFERDAFSLLPPRTISRAPLPVEQFQRLRLLGDYQFSALRLGDTGGLRVTGGLLISLRQSDNGLLLANDASALPYAGIGYASGGIKGNWGFSADLGLAAQGLGGLRFDRLISGGGLGVDGSLRLLPMVRLGVNLAF